jgi:hypothetical protein
MHQKNALKTGWVFTTAAFGLFRDTPPLRINDLRSEKSSVSGPIREVGLVYSDPFFWGLTTDAHRLTQMRTVALFAEGVKQIDISNQGFQ